MNEPAQIPALLPALPEIVLALGAMALLMFGVYRGERSAQLTHGIAIALLLIAAVLVAMLPAGKLVTFGGSFVVDNFARFMKILALIGTFKTNAGVAVFATLGIILSAAYALWLYRKVIFGPLKPHLAGIMDLDAREIVVLAPLVFLTILFGIYPRPVLDLSAASVTALLENYERAIGLAKAAALAAQ